MWREVKKRKERLSLPLTSRLSLHLKKSPADFPPTRKHLSHPHKQDYIPAIDAKISTQSLEQQQHTHTEAKLRYLRKTEEIGGGRGCEAGRGKGGEEEGEWGWVRHRYQQARKEKGSPSLRTTQMVGRSMKQRQVLR